MRLINIQVAGVRRFVKPSTLRINGRLTAIVGPNESGKTSLLHAIEALSLGNELRTANASRSADRGETYVEADFVFGDEEAASLGLPVGQRVKIRKRAGETSESWILEPELQVDVAGRALVTKELTEALQAFAAREDSGGPDLGAIQRARALLGSKEPFSNEQSEEIQIVAEQLDDVGEERFVPLADELRRIAEQGLTDEGRASLIEKLRPTLPAFVFFSNADRDLQDEYSLAEVLAEMPPALANLSALARMDWAEFARLSDEGNTGLAESKLHQANDRLLQELAAWHQHSVTVRLSCETSSGGTIRVFVGGHGEYFRASERSSGLLWFIALIAFLSGKHVSLSRPPVLLIDEAETHLHYDAQADLIEQMLNQTLTAEVIYTTHSAGCLPPDLSRVRVVEPTAETGTSRIENRFWSRRDQRVSALIMRMGATNFAFTRSRSALVTEGPSDYLWLPRMFREVDEATDLLGFQVVPGLSGVEPSLIGELDAEAGKVAYLLDGDAGGAANREKLDKGGIPEARIVTLKALSIENVVAPELLAQAMNRICELTGSGARVDSAAFGDEMNAGAYIDDWFKQQGISAGKVDVAEVAIEIAEDSENAIVPGDKAELLRSALSAIREGLRTR